MISASLLFLGKSYSSIANVHPNLFRGSPYIRGLLGYMSHIWVGAGV